MKHSQSYKNPGTSRATEYQLDKLISFAEKAVTGKLVSSDRKMIEIYLKKEDYKREVYDGLCKFLQREGNKEELKEFLTPSGKELQSIRSKWGRKAETEPEDNKSNNARIQLENFIEQKSKYTFGLEPFNYEKYYTQIIDIENLIAQSRTKLAFKTTIQFVREIATLEKNSKFLILSLMYSEKYYRYTTRYMQGVISIREYELHQNKCIILLLELLQEIKSTLAFGRQL